MSEGNFSEPEQERKLFLGGLSYNTKEDNIKEYFGQFGEIVDCCVIKDPGSQKSKGFGFVTFSSRKEVDKVMGARKENPHRLDNRAVDVRRAMARDEKGPKNPSFKCFVGGIPKETTEEDLRQYFGQFGCIVELALHLSKGFAFITYDDTDCVDQIVMKKYHKINGKKVEGKKAYSKEEMRDMKMREQQGGNYGGQGGGYRGGQGGGGGYGGHGGGYGGGGDYQGGYGGGGGGYNQGYGGGQGGYGGGGGGYGGGGYSGGGGNFSDFGSNYGGQNSNYGPVRGGGGGSGGGGGGRNQGPYPSNNGGSYNGGGQGGPQGYGGGAGGGYQGGGGGYGGGPGGGYSGGGGGYGGGGGGGYGKRF